MLLERTVKCQDLYKVNISQNVTGRVEGGETTFLLCSVFHCQSCELPTLGQEWFLCRQLFHKVVCFCRVFSDHIGVGVCILMAGLQRLQKGSCCKEDQGGAGQTAGEGWCMHRNGLSHVFTTVAWAHLPHCSAFGVQQKWTNSPLNQVDDSRVWENIDLIKGPR